MRWAGLLVCGALAGCRFDVPQISSDATSGGELPANTPDAGLCFGRGLGRLCLVSPPTQSRTLTGTIDTGIDTACTEIVPVTGTDVCVVAGTSIDIAVTAVVRGIGIRPLVLVSATSIHIQGTLDVGSQRGTRGGAGAQDVTCPNLELARNDDGGGGGGAGGSFFGTGGDGGTGDLNNNGLPAGTAAGGTHAAASTPIDLRAGCRGGNGGSGGNGSTAGTGGRGGGAVYLIAGTDIRISGRVVAYGGGGGGGGVQGGGGGGGSGGMIGLDAPTIIVSGFLAANGGGGGEGAGVAVGVSGDDGSIDGSRAAGGIAPSNDGSNNDGGNGGRGSGGSVLSGSNGNNDNGGAGGGGGGAGFVYVKGALELSGSASPAPTVAP